MGARLHQLSNTGRMTSQLVVPLPKNLSGKGPTAALGAGTQVREDQQQDSTSALTITVCSATGGVGTSVLSALVALELAGRGLRVGLMDESPECGGLDILLGLEEDDGLRWQDVEAPMGTLDGQAFCSELLTWEGIQVLSAAPWSGSTPDPWEVSAAYRALAEFEDVLVIDSSARSPNGPPGFSKQRRAGGIVPGSESGGVHHTRLVAVELSVLGVARAKAFINQLCASPTGPAPPCIYVAVPLHSGRRAGKGAISTVEAAAYLGVDFVGVLRPQPALAKNLSAGLGIMKVPKRSAPLISSICDQLCGSQASVPPSVPPSARAPSKHKGKA